MEAVDSNSKGLVAQPSPVLSTMLKLESAFVFVCFGGAEIGDIRYLSTALGLAGAVAIVNQVTEARYNEKALRKEKLLILVKSLLLILALYLAAYLAAAWMLDLSFIRTRKGIATADTARIWAVSGLLGFTGAMLAVDRTIGVFCDYLWTRKFKARHRLDPSLLPQQPKSL